MHKCTIALFERREKGEALPNVGNFEKQTRLSRQVWPPLEFCAQARAQKRGPVRRISHAATKSSPLLQLLLGSLVVAHLPLFLSSFEWHSNGASFPFKSGGNKKVRPNRFLPCRCRRRCVRCTNSRLARSWKVGNPTPTTSVRPSAATAAGVIMTKSLAL